MSKGKRSTRIPDTSSLGISHDTHDMQTLASKLVQDSPTSEGSKKGMST